MAEPFLSEIRIMSFGFAARGWALCNGQLLPINQNQALFALLGTTYGGNGSVNFALPNLQGRVPIHMGAGHTLGESGGEQNHTVSISEMPAHSHLVNAATTGTPVAAPSSARMLARSAGANAWGGAIDLAPMDARTLASNGGSQPHSNMQPHLVLNFSIALQGIFPSQN